MTDYTETNPEMVGRARTPDDYPYSCRIDSRTRLCPICDRGIDDAVYAVHWEAAHPAHSRLLRAIEWNPPMLDAWAGQGYPLREPREVPAMLRDRIREVMDLWTDAVVHALLDDETDFPSFMEALAAAMADPDDPGRVVVPEAAVDPDGEPGGIDWI